MTAFYFAIYDCMAALKEINIIQTVKFYNILIDRIIDIKNQLRNNNTQLEFEAKTCLTEQT